MRQQESEQKPQVLIIAWKWRQLPHINENWKGNPGIDHYIQHINEGLGTIYKEYPVEFSDRSPNAKVVTTAIFNADEKTQELLQALLAKYTQPGHQTIVLLHRSNGFEEEHIEPLVAQFSSEESQTFKCYLFGAGHDFIYYDTQKGGLLDQEGNFYRKRDEKTGQLIHVAGLREDTKEQEIKQPYFNRVWEYYRTAFEMKVFRLKEEICDAWLPYLLPDQPEEISAQTLKEALSENEDRALFYRLKNFLGMHSSHHTASPDLNQEEEGNYDLSRSREVALIKAVEKADKISYRFDDYLANLKPFVTNEETLVDHEYLSLKKGIEALFFNHSKLDTTKKEVRHVIERFNFLVKVIPGVLD